MSTRPLNDRQTRFVDELLVDGVAGRAYERAGYQATGDSADAKAARLLTDARVQQRLAEKRAARSSRVELDADWVVRRLRQNLKAAMQEQNRAAANKALELLGKHIGMFVNKHEITGKDGGPLEVDLVDVRARVLARLAKLAPAPAAS